MPNSKSNHAKSLVGALTLAFLLTPHLPAARAVAQRAKPGISKGATMRLAGRHTFAVTHRQSVAWTLDRAEAAEAGGAPTLFKNIAHATGATATFDLTKTPDKETVYYVRAGPQLRRRVPGAGLPARSAFVLYLSERGQSRCAHLRRLPATLSAKTRVVLVMHGGSRNADGYIDTWVDWAARHDYLALAPRFDDKNWGGDKYNLGNVFAGKNGAGNQNPEAQWSFTVVEGIHERARNEFQLADPLFDIWGHSAGGQFVHRFMLFKPQAKVRYALPANAGWYTTPDLALAFPYGVKHPLLNLDKRDLVRWTSKPVVIFRGTADTLRTDNLSMTPEADAQGLNRFERAAFMYRQVKTLNPRTDWRMIEVLDVGHDQRKMAPAAQDFLRAQSAAK